MNRRRVLGLLAALPAAAPPALARDYASEEEVREAIDALAVEVEAHLHAIARAVPRAAAFVTSARADLARHRRERGAPPAAPPGPSHTRPASLPGLRTALEALVHAHAEGLPALRQRAAVRRLAEHMVDLSRLMAVVDLWIESESADD